MAGGDAGKRSQKEYWRDRQNCSYRAKLYLPYLGDWRYGSRKREKQFKDADYGGSALDSKRACEAWIYETKTNWSKDNRRSRTGDELLPLGVFADRDWELITSGLRPNVKQGYESGYRLHAHDLLGHIRLCDLRPSHLEALKVNLIGKALSPSRINSVINAVSCILNFALKDRLIDENPAAARGVRVREVKSKKRSRVIATPEQVRRLAARCEIVGGPGYGAPVEYGFWTQKRANEIWATKVGDISLEDRKIHVARAWVGVDENRQRLLSDPKSWKDRWVPILDPVFDLCAALVEGRDPDEWLFTGRTGNAIWHGNYRKSVDWVNTVASENLPEFRVHDLRHSGATYLLESRVPVHVVQAILGHASLATTQGYVHARPEMFDMAIDLVGDGR